MANTMSFYSNIDLDETKVAAVPRPAIIHWIFVFNQGATPAYVKLFNKAVGDVTVGSTAPDMTFPVPAQSDSNGAGFMIPLSGAIYFSTAVTIAATTGVEASDSGAPGTNDVIVNFGYTG